MKCYNHHDRDAFGICKICGKALCLECMDKNSKNIICANDKDCYEKNMQVEKYYQNANVIYSAKSIAKIKMFGAFLLIIGLLCTAISFISTVFNAGMCGIGLVCIILGITNIRRANELTAIEDNGNNKIVNKNFIKYLFLILAICFVVFILSIFLIPATPTT